MPVKFLRRTDGSTGTIPEDLTFTVPAVAASVDVDVWVSNGNYKLVGIRTTHSVAGGASAAARPRKITDTSAPGAAASGTVLELAAAIDFTASANVVRTPVLTALASTTRFKAGDRLALDFSGTLTALVGHITFYLKRTEFLGADN